MGYKLAMLLGLTGLLMADQADSVCCDESIYTGPDPGFADTCRVLLEHYGPHNGLKIIVDHPECFVCGDGTQGTPYCGYGPCNIFGCNCGGGCRSRKRSMTDLGEARRLLELLEGENAMPGRGFEDHDTAEELARVAEEARGLLELLRGEQDNTSPPEESDRAGPGFGHHDADQDMKLSKEEALEMLKKMEYVDISNLPDDWFESLDTNGNGYIDPEEYDKDLAKDLE